MILTGETNIAQVARRRVEININQHEGTTREKRNGDSVNDTKSRYVEESPE